MRGGRIEQRIEGAGPGYLGAVAGNTMRSLPGLGINDPITLYGVAISDGATRLSAAGIWTSAGSVFHLQESSVNPGQFVAGSGQTGYARIDGAVARGLFVGSAVWTPGVNVYAYSGALSSLVQPTAQVPTEERYLQGNTTWLKVYAYKGAHTPAQRRRIEATLAREYTGTPDGVAGPAVATRTTGGTTSNIAGQSTASLEPLTMYCAYTADGTMSTAYPTLMQVYSDVGRRAIFQGRPADLNGFGIRVDTTGLVNQSFSTVGVGREAGPHVLALRINQGITAAEFWVDGVPSTPTVRTLTPGDGIGRTTLYLAPVTTHDVTARRGMFYNQFHSDVQVNLISAWLRRSIAP